MNNNKHQRELSSGLNRFWILGGGRFGQIAIERITRHIPGAIVTVVDKKPVISSGDGIHVIAGDAIAWLVERFDHQASVDFILPAVPIHVAVQWLRMSFKGELTPIEIPDDGLISMPNAMRGKTGQVFISNADFICPDNCPEPKTICTHTGKPRPKDLFVQLSEWRYADMLPIVVRSYQLLPGVGGLKPRDLLAAREQLNRLKGRQVMVATACRCHGVVDFLQIE